MTKYLRGAAISGTLIACATVAVPTSALFHSPQVASVTDAYVPYQVVFDGFVVLEVFVDANGVFTEAKALRDPGAMTPAAVAAARMWKFSPAGLGDRTLPSAITVAFVYRPRNNGPAAAVPPKDFMLVLPHPVRHTKEEPEYIPAGIVSVAYPDYPANSVAWGSVVVQVTVNAQGQVESPQALYGAPPFKALALDALKKWRFRPATLGGEAVPSQIPIAFVFQTPLS